MVFNVCLYGLNRSLSLTHAALQRYLFAALAAAGVEYRVYGCLIRMDVPYSNPRSGELEALPECSEAELLAFSQLVAIDQQTIDALVDWPEIFAWGDCYGEITADTLGASSSSTKNHVRALHALRSAFHLIPTQDRDHPTIFLRPDLEILDELPIPLILDLLQLPPKRLNGGATDGVAIVPMWHSWDGVNDRFAVCSGGYAAAAYAERIERLGDYLRMCAKPIHPESFLLHALMLRRVHILPVIQTPMVRIRSAGQVQPELFHQGATTWSHASQSWSLLVERNAQLLSRLESLNERLAEQSQACDALEAQLALSGEQAQVLRAELACASRDRAAALDLQRSQSIEQQDRIHQLESQLASTLADMRGLSSTLEAAQRRLAQQDAEQHSADALQAQLQQVSAEADALLEQLFWAQEELERYYLEDPAMDTTSPPALDLCRVASALALDTLQSINQSRRQLLEEVAL